MIDQSPVLSEFRVGDEASARALGIDLHTAGYFVKTVRSCDELTHSRYADKHGWCVQAESTLEKRAADSAMLNDLADAHGVLESYPPNAQ